MIEGGTRPSKNALFLLQLSPGQMRYFLGVDIGSVNAKLSLIDEDGRAVRPNAEKVSCSLRAAVTSLIARLGETFHLE